MYELKLLADSRKRVQNKLTGMTPEDSLQYVLTTYTDNREQGLRAQQQKFEDEYFKKPEDKEQHLEAVTWMSWGISSNSVKGVPKLINKQLMYINEGMVLPITPLVQRILLGMYNATKELKTIFHTTAS